MTRTFMYYILALSLLASCTGMETDSPEERPGGGEDEKVAMSIQTLSLREETKAIYDDTGNDENSNPNHLGSIKVLVTKGSGTVEYYSDSNQTQTFTCSSGEGGKTWSTTSILYLGDTEGSVYAWAPATMDGELNSNSPKIPVMKSPIVSAEQTFAYNKQWNTSQVDYLYGTNAEKSTPKVSRQQSSVALSMQHALSKISFKVMKANGQTVTSEDYVKKVELTSSNTAFVMASTPASSVTMKLADGTLTGTSTTSTLTLTATTGTSEQGPIATWAETSGGGDGTADFSEVTPQAYGLVAPANVGDIGVKITLGAAGALDDKDHTYSTTSNNKISVNWVKGKHYIYTMTVTDRGLEFNSVSVADWESSGDPVAVPVE